MAAKLRQLNIKLRRIKLDPHQEQARFRIAMLVRVQNIAVVPQNKIGNGGHQALTIRTSH
jgi:hypothetical protein